MSVRVTDVHILVIYGSKMGGGQVDGWGMLGVCSRLFSESESIIIQEGGRANGYSEIGEVQGWRNVE